VPGHEKNCRTAIRLVLTAALLVPTGLMLGACAGGGGGGGSAVTPLPPPPPPPPPPPSPPPPPFPATIAPPSAFETREYNATVGLPMIGASSAYAIGATGQGIKVAVIDTGSITDHPDFDGASITTFDVCASAACPGYDSAGDLITQVRQPGDIDTGGHGTLVTGVIAAVRQDDFRTTADDNVANGIQGIAYEASVLDIRADSPGSCARTGEDEGCSFTDSSLVRAIDHAIAQGVTIINMSLGGDVDTDPTLENAVRRAAEAGILVVISAGNDAEPAGTDDMGNPVDAVGQTPSEPAYIAGEAASLGRVVAVGSIDTSRTISDFSNRAGEATKNYYLMAPGEGIVTTGLDDDIMDPGLPTCVGSQTTGCNDPDSDGDYYRVSGTSFSAPYVAGALALLLDAFPNLKQNPELALQILLDTADDYVDASPDLITGAIAGAGADSVSGVGIMNLAEAFRPQGQQTLSISVDRVSLGEALAPSGGAFGDWASNSGAFNGLVFQDKYDRGFRLDADATAKRLPKGLLGSRVVDMNTRADWAASQSRAVAVGDLSLAWFTPRVQEDRLAPYQADPVTNFQAAYSFNGGEVEFGRGGGISRLAPDVTLFNEPGIGNAFSTSGNWARVSHQTPFGLTMDLFTATEETRSLTGVSLGRDARFWSVRAGISSASDTQTALGGSLQDRFGETDQTDMTAYSLEGEWNPFGRLTLSSGMEMASVDLPGIDSRDIWTSRWSVGAAHPAGPGALSLVIAQPRRAETGTIRFLAPTGMDERGAIVQSDIEAGLTPSGRQIDYETRYRFRLFGDWTGEASAALSTSPNHISGSEDESVAWFAVGTKW
jgi:subtilisin family serine protease